MAKPYLWKGCKDMGRAVTPARSVSLFFALNLMQMIRSPPLNVSEFDIVAPLISRSL